MILLGDEFKLALDVLQAATFPESLLNHQAGKQIRGEEMFRNFTKRDFS